MNSLQFLEFLITISLHAAILVGATAFLCRAAQSARLHCDLWNLCNVLLLLITIAGAILPHLRVVGNPWQSLSPGTLRHFVITEAAVGQFALIGWCAGMILSLATLISEWFTATRFLKSCRRATDSEVSQVLREQIGACNPGSRRPHPPVQVLVSNRLTSPFCCQWHSPVLVLPEFLLKMPDADITFIARHELAHLRCGHPLQLFVERVVMTLFWFHPAIWWASRQSLLAREYACDDAAVIERREAVAYLKTLLAIAERGLCEEAMGSTLSFGNGARVVALRGQRLLARFEAKEPWTNRESAGGRWTYGLLLCLAIVVWPLWIPVDLLASSRMRWSPWPHWSASVLRAVEIPARDYEPYEKQTRLYELSAESPNHTR